MSNPGASQCKIRSTPFGFEVSLEVCTGLTVTVTTQRPRVKGSRTLRFRAQGLRARGPKAQTL